MSSSVSGRDPRFSIVVAAYNAEATVGATLESALRQTVEDFEVVVVDDGSTDGTAAVLRSFGRDPRVRVVSQENRGLAGARNSGLRVARAPFVSLLDADDVWLPSYLDGIAASFEERPDVDVVYPRAWVLDELSRRIERREASWQAAPPAELPADPRELLVELLRRNFMFYGATIRREALQTVGGFDERLRAAEDYDLWLRLAATGHRFARTPGIHVVYRRRPGSLSHDRTLMVSSVRSVFASIACSPGLDRQAQELALARLADLDRLAGELAAPSLAMRLRDALGGVRARAGLAKRRVLPGLTYLRIPPAAVTAAFPDLRAL